VLAALRASTSPQGGGGTVEERAKVLRKNMTPTERMLWAILRQLKIQGLHFRRQAPFGRYILDFVCHTAKLVVEVDSSQHATPEGIRHDKKRTAFLKSRGYRVLRYGNLDVLTNREGVVDGIVAATNASVQNAALPPPCGEVDARSAASTSGGGPPPEIADAISTSPQGGGKIEGAP
jgi:very-short-patch-repair endonuclease